jgi:hypothetical protein
VASTVTNRRVAMTVESVEAARLNVPPAFMLNVENPVGTPAPSR